MKVFFILVLMIHTPEFNDWEMRQYARGSIGEEDLSIFTTRKECEKWLIDKVWGHYNDPNEIAYFKNITELLKDDNGHTYIYQVGNQANVPHSESIYKCLEVHDQAKIGNKL